MLSDTGREFASEKHPLCSPVLCPRVRTRQRLWIEEEDSADSAETHLVGRLARSVAHDRLRRIRSAATPSVMKSSQDGTAPGSSSTSSAFVVLAAGPSSACVRERNPPSLIAPPGGDQVLRAHPGSPDSPPSVGSVKTVPGVLPPSALLPRCEPKALTAQFEARSPRSDKKEGHPMWATLFVSLYIS
jgi:hypothetical protein